MINMMSKLLILLLVNSITGFFLDVDVDTESGSPLDRQTLYLINIFIEDFHPGLSVV